MVSEEKKKLVKQIADFVKEYPIIGVVNMSNLPAPQLQNMRASLRDSMKMVMTRKTLLARGLELAGKENVKDLIGYFKGMPALIFTKENPFTLYKTLEKNKSSAPAKAGQEAPKDIVVKAGVTPFAPGPVIGELGAVGIKSGVDGGKVTIKEDSIVAKEGDIINAKVAEILKRLGVEPMEIGLNLVAVWEKGTIFKGSDLHIDEAEYEANILNAAQWAINLSIEAGIPTKDTIELMIIKAFRDSKAVALEGNVLADAVLEEVLGNVERGALALKAEAKVETGAKPVEEKKEEKVEEKPVEEKKPEPKPEPEVPKEEPEPVSEPVKEEPKVEETPAEVETKEQKETSEKLEEAKEELKEETGVEVPEEVKEEKVEEKPVEEKEPEPAHEHKEEEPTEEEQKIKAEKEIPQELVEPDQAPGDIIIEKPDVEKEHVEETEEIPEPKEVIEDTPVELSEEEKESAEEEAEKDVEELGSKKPEPDVEEMKSRAEVIKERIKDLKKEEEASPAVKEMVKKTKEFAEKGKGPSAADLLGEVEEEEKVEDVKKEEVPSAQELYDRLKKKGTLRNEKPDHVPSAHELAKRKRKS
ncbi:50S ribosomal protein L10 [Candidatus Woesearchaeota archaeon]|nr:50S ribosomal protein L10 [Candidatus Woesearchaeota archaeon]